MVHGPHVEAVAGHDVHQGVLALARNRQVVARTGGIRRAVHEEQDGLLFARLRGHPLAVKIELHAALVRPVFVRLNLGLCLRVRLADEARDEPGPCPGDDGTACDGMASFGHGFLRRCDVCASIAKQGVRRHYPRHDSALEGPDEIRPPPGAEGHAHGRSLARARPARLRANRRSVLSRMDRDVPPSRPRQGHFGRDLFWRHERLEAGQVRVLGDPQPAGVQPAALAVPQPPRLRLAHPDGAGPAQGVRPAARAHREGFRGPARHHSRAVGHRVRPSATRS